MHGSQHVICAALESLFQSGADAGILAGLAQTNRHLRSAAHRHAADLSHGQERYAVLCDRDAKQQLLYPSVFVYANQYPQSFILSDAKGCCCTGRSLSGG